MGNRTAAISGEITTVINGVNVQAARILRPPQAVRAAGFREHAAGRAAARAWIWWCQAVRLAKARVTAAVRLETCSRR
jgi:hypothetical protein